jgi:hypothetical protein
MANISINGLAPAGSALFAGSENFLGSVRDLSEAELGISGGGGHHYGSGSGKSKSKSYKSKSKSYKSKSKSYSGHGGHYYH